MKQIKRNMNVLNERLETVTGYLINITRDWENGWYFIEVAVPISWEIGDNDDIECEILNESEKGKIIKIAPKNDTVLIDDLILFAEVIIETNIEIEKKEKEFEEQIRDMKKKLELQAKDFYTQLDEHKKTSFKNLKKNIETVNGSKEKQQTEAKTTKRGRPSKKDNTENLSVDTEKPTDDNSSVLNKTENI